MATIRAPKQAAGITRYTAMVRIRKGSTVIHQENRTFTHRSAALTWAKDREVALEDPSALIRIRAHRHSPNSSAGTSINFEGGSKWQQ